ncbi:helix-turn-helix domain-containing protein [Aurantiacibacter aquimixticola]|uniref:XRE family transcriptional regulator n=1 Tax=Aurantiacibacter aquimixticola TaxID=1958945 RepID=A0A419RU65_9SPHN|nr:helix-turn-helix transcriptional regulator [Aurantiacibacter aquimixticola]RJY09319.1 XRE family transcriptional regulator [Aurantiacibacter aquimixticola]
MPRQSPRTDTDGKLRKLGDAIRAARYEIGMSQEALADASGIDRSHMGKIERGERNVSVLNVARVADALNVSIASLMASAGL